VISIACAGIVVRGYVGVVRVVGWGCCVACEFMRGVHQFTSLNDGNVGVRKRCGIDVTRGVRAKVRR